MPQVPTYNQQVDPKPIPGATLSSTPTPDAFGAGINRGVQSVTNAVADVYLQEKDRQDKVATLASSARPSRPPRSSSARRSTAGWSPTPCRKAGSMTPSRPTPRSR